MIPSDTLKFYSLCAITTSRNFFSSSFTLMIQTPFYPDNFHSLTVFKSPWYFFFIPSFFLTHIHCFRHFYVYLKAPDSPSPFLFANSRSVVIFVFPFSLSSLFFLRLEFLSQVSAAMDGSDFYHAQIFLGSDTRSWFYRLPDCRIRRSYIARSNVSSLLSRFAISLAPWVIHPRRI